MASQTHVTWFGQSAFKIVTPAGNVLLIDPWLANPKNPSGKEDLANLKRVDLIFVTHGHSDHVGDAVEIAKKTGAKLSTGETTRRFGGRNAYSPATCQVASLWNAAIALASAEVFAPRSFS